MKKKVLCCIAVVAILMCVVPVSVVAMDCNDNSLNNASNRLAENKMSKMPADQEIKLQGTAVSGDVGDFVWWRVAVDDVIFGPLSCSDTIAVYCGGGGVIPDAYIDPDITPGDKVEVYGYYTCTGHEFDYVEPYRSDHYIKRIETCGKILDYTISDGIYPPGQIVRATMLYKSLMSTPADFKGVFKVRSPTGEIYSNSKKERTPAGGEDSFGYYGDGDVLDRRIPEDASTGWYDAKLELRNFYTDELCDETEWMENQFKIEENEVKFRGFILVDHLIFSFYSFDIQIDEILNDPNSNLQIGETVNVYGHRDGPAHVDNVTVGDRAEVFGEYQGYVGTYERIFLSGYFDNSSDHYVKKLLPANGSINITSISPPIGTTLIAGNSVTFTVTVDYDLGPNDYGKIRLSVNQYTTGTTDKEYSIGTLDPHSGSYTFTHIETIGDDWENVYVSVSLYAAKQGEPLPAEYTDFDYKHYPVKEKGSLLHFDLDYKGTEPASGNGDGNDQHQIYTQAGQSFVTYLFYKEGNAGNQYIIRAYPEWDQNSFILNSDNDESTSELAQEMGGHRYDVENYIIPSVPGEYKIKVVYSNSAAPPTWDNYNRLLGAFTVIVEGGGDCIETVPSDHWNGEYYNNKNLEGSPLMVRDDGTGYLDFDWDVSSPSTSCGIGSDFFSVRWTRTLNFDSGTWRFTATTDDGMRVYVDGSLVIDKWFNQVATTYTADVDLTAGTHTIIVEYYEYDQTAVAKLSWVKDDGKEVKFTGTATDYWVSGGQIHHWTVLVDEVISGPQPCEDQVDITVYDFEFPPPWGYVDPNLNIGDRVEVYGRYYDGHCSAMHLHGSTDYYIKKIEETKCGEILNWKSECRGKYCPPKKIGADMWFQNLCGGGYNFKGVIILKSQSPDGYEYTGSRIEWVPSSPNPHGEFLSAAGDALEVLVPEDAAPGYYDIKLQLWNVDMDPDELCDEIEWNESLFEILEPCEGTDTSCGCRPDCVNCNDHDGWHCKLDILGNSDIREYRDYYCSGRSCAYTVTSSENCNDYDCWVDTGNTKWVDVNECQEKEQKEQEYWDYYCSGGACTYSVTDTQWLDTGNTRNKPYGTDCGHDGWKDTGNTKWEVLSECQEKERKEQEYRDYYCSDGFCTYSVTGTQWVDTGNTRNKPDGTICDCTARNTLKRCYSGVCTDTGICDSSICGADAACDGKRPGDSCSGGTCDSNCKCGGQVTGEDYGVFWNGLWFVDTTGDHAADEVFGYGFAGATPLVGDIDQDGTDDIAIVGAYSGNYRWFVDTTGDHVADKVFWFGFAGAIPLVGDIDQDGTDDIAIVKAYGGNYMWFVDTNFDKTADQDFWFGPEGATPLVGDFDQDGTDDIAVIIVYGGNYRWFVDTNGDHVVDEEFWFGFEGAIPLVGDIDRDGTDDIAIVKAYGGNYMWFVDTNCDKTADQVFWFGFAGAIPLVGDIG